jgi:hypothetical protein
MRSSLRLALLALALGLLWPAAVGAQPAPSQYFPETGHTVSGRFLEYWRSNGGLPVFGYPIGEQISEGGRQVQYFERQRFELHPENARPYDVLLGLLGSERLAAGAPPPPTMEAPGCMFFATTRHNVCNQQGALGFLSYWRSNGLEFDGRRGKSYEESLALFGYPLSEAYDYTLVTGEQVYAQWFERARFEWHPGNPDKYKVLLGRLGAEAMLPPAPGPGLVDTVQIFLIDLEGGTIGCGDAVVPVTRQITPTAAPLRAALNELFSLKSQMYGESGLYNALYQSDLRIDRVAIVNGQAQVSLSGRLLIGGVCDEPRVVAQIESTVRQFLSVTSTMITVNGVPLADAVR